MGRKNVLKIRLILFRYKLIKNGIQNNVNWVTSWLNVVVTKTATISYTFSKLSISM